MRAWKNHWRLEVFETDRAPQQSVHILMNKIITRKGCVNIGTQSDHYGVQIH